MHEDAPDCEQTVATAVESAPCWRCSLPVAMTEDVCPHCQARQRHVNGEERSSGTSSIDDSRLLKTLILSYVVLLTTSVILAVAFNNQFGDADELTPSQRQEAWAQIIAVEVIDSIVVLIAYLVLRRASLSPVPTPPGRIWYGLASFPALGVMLAINFAYHAILTEVIGVPSLEDELIQGPAWVVLFCVCIQPAIVEEAYCRGLALGILRQFVGNHGAVWISAVMFGMMHISAMLSIPCLILIGVFFGYVRLATGALWLPMALHFLHNLAVVLYEWN